MATLTVVLYQLLILKLGQLKRMLFSPKRFFRLYNSLHYTSFLQQNIACLNFAACINNLTSRAITAYIAVNCPLNCVFMAILIMNPQKLLPQVKFFIIVIMIQQWICVFGVHMQETELNKRLHRPCQRMLHLVAVDRFLRLPSGTDKDLRLKVKIANYITAFHVMLTVKSGMA